MGKFENKKLLFLGTSVASVSMVRYARQEGAYVIVTDNLPIELSEAKKYANEISFVSTRDIDAICDLAIEKKVDGILSGVSEGNLPVMQKVCNVLGLPCYFNAEQWDLCQNKKRFKDLCVKNGVPVPREYTEEDIAAGNISFPVIVKPVDGFAAVGITICHSWTELECAVEVAKRTSKTGRIIVEDYVTGTEITSVYTIKDGEISLSFLRDRYPSLDHPGVTAQFDASIGPSRFFKEYSTYVDPAIKRMLSDIGAYAGVVFFQGIATDKGIFIFECGYRMNALCDFFNLDAANGINYMEMMVEYALTGHMGGADLSCDNPDPDQFCCIYNMTAHEGTIGTLSGLEECLKLPGVQYAEFLLPVGHHVVENNSMAQSVFRAYINAPDMRSLRYTIEEMQKYIRVVDGGGQNMLFMPFDVKRIVNTLDKWRFGGNSDEHIPM